MSTHNIGLYEEISKIILNIAHVEPIEIRLSSRGSILWVYTVYSGLYIQKLINCTQLTRVNGELDLEFIQPCYQTV